jgi:hypothetical protein
MFLELMFLNTIEINKELKLIFVGLVMTKLKKKSLAKKIYY